jgi:hypothetical protein
MKLIKINPSNTLVDGSRWPSGWAFNVSADATLDKGPSPAGNPGPYLHAARFGSDTRHRLYPKAGLVPVLAFGRWYWTRLA